MNRYGLILVCICILDLAITVGGVETGQIKEFNPLLLWYLMQWGISGFILAKIFFIVAPISIFELLSLYSKIGRQKISNYYKITIFAYIIIFNRGI